MKPLFITIIVLVIPIFFVFVFVMSTVSKLTGLRNRCREMLEPRRAALAPDSLATPVPEPKAGEDFNLAAQQYNAARSRFPANLLAALCGFHEIEPLPNRTVGDRPEAP